MFVVIFFAITQVFQRKINNIITLAIQKNENMSVLFAYCQ